MKVAVIYFPGNNCEEETKRAAEAAGMKADIIRWNDKKANLASYDGYLIPGGWAYEDRIRAGVIASKDHVMDTIRIEAKKGKPVLGICNGAQVLVETGLIPGLKDEVQMALAPNRNPFVAGYYVDWVYLKMSSGKKNAFNMLLKEDDVLQIPIAHGEGRYTTTEKGLIESLDQNQQLVFRYCNAQGEIIDKFPINPNGSMWNIAAVCNKEGNVMAIMPHPERATWLRQMPDTKEKILAKGDFQKMEGPGPGRKIFESMKKYIEGRK
jgi:phosphoribosylformylglycinamidine synthase I